MGLPGLRSPERNLLSCISVHLLWAACLWRTVTNTEKIGNTEPFRAQTYTPGQGRCKDVHGHAYVCAHAEHESKLFEIIFKHFLTLEHLRVDVKPFYLGMNCILYFTLHICRSYSRATDQHTHSYDPNMQKVMQSRGKHLHDCFIAAPNILSLSSVTQFTNSINSYRCYPASRGAPEEHIPPSSPVCLVLPRASTR